MNGEWKQNLYYGQPFYDATSYKAQYHAVLLMESYDAKMQDLHLFLNHRNNGSKKSIINIDSNCLFPVFDVYLGLTLKHILQLMKYLIINGKSYSSVTSFNMNSVIDIFVRNYIPCTPTDESDDYFISNVYQLFMELQSLDQTIISNSLMIVTEFTEAVDAKIIEQLEFDPLFHSYILDKIADDYKWNERICQSKSNAALERYFTVKYPQRQLIRSIEPMKKLKLILLSFHYIKHKMQRIESHFKNCTELIEMSILILNMIGLKDDLHMKLFVNGNGHILLIDIIRKIFHTPISNEVYKCMNQCFSTLHLLVVRMKAYLMDDRNEKSYKKNIEMVTDTCVTAVTNLIKE